MSSTGYSSGPLQKLLSSYNAKDTLFYQLLMEIPLCVKSGKSDLFEEKWKVFHDHFASDQYKTPRQSMYINTLNRACDSGNQEIFDRLLPLCRAPDMTLFFYPLRTTVEQGHKALFFHILSVIKESGLTIEQSRDSDYLFRVIVLHGDIDMAKAFLPFVNLKARHSAFLRLACEHHRETMIDFLLPFSNMKSALTYMRKRKNITDDDRRLLERIVKAVDDKKHITKHMGQGLKTGQNTKRKKPKM